MRRITPTVWWKLTAVWCFVFLSFFLVEVRSISSDRRVIDGSMTFSCGLGGDDDTHLFPVPLSPNKRQKEKDRLNARGGDCEQFFITVAIRRLYCGLSAGSLAGRLTSLSLSHPFHSDLLTCLIRLIAHPPPSPSLSHPCCHLVFFIYLFFYSIY